MLYIIEKAVENIKIKCISYLFCFLAASKTWGGIGTSIMVYPKFFNNMTHEDLPILFLCVSVPKFVLVLRPDFFSEARSNWWKVSQYSPLVCLRVLLFLLNMNQINKAWRLYQYIITWSGLGGGRWDYALCKCSSPSSHSGSGWCYRTKKSSLNLSM